MIDPTGGSDYILRELISKSQIPPKQVWGNTRKTIANMSDEGFDALVEQFIKRGEDKVTLPTFLQVMADIAKQRAQHEVELTGRMINGQVIFENRCQERSKSPRLS